jgi:anti-anti-sigma factor
MLVPDGDTLSISVRDRSDARHLRLAGRFDVVTSSALDREVDSGWPRDVVLDLGALTFMDGAGWLAVMALQQRVRDRGKNLRVVNVPERIRMIFEVTETAYLLTEPV